MDKSILTVSEVAEYLSLSDKTVLKLIRNKEIPCARVGHQWRFVRQVLDEWLIERMNVASADDDLPGKISDRNGIFRLSSLTREPLIRTDLSPGNREHILSQLVQIAVEQRLLTDGKLLMKGLWEREMMVSTALGHGVAVPHLRKPCLSLSEHPVISIGLCAEGVSFGAPDKKPTFLFLLILSKSEIVHLRILAKVSQLLRDYETCQILINSKTPSEVMQNLIIRENVLFPGNIQEAVQDEH